MKPAAVLLVLLALLTVPAAEASCHWCTGEVVAACSALDARGCADKAVHLALHLDELALWIVTDPEGFVCAMDPDHCQPR